MPWSASRVDGPSLERAPSTRSKTPEPDLRTRLLTREAGQLRRAQQPLQESVDKFRNRETLTARGLGLQNGRSL